MAREKARPTSRRASAGPMHWQSRNTNRFTASLAAENPNYASENEITFGSLCAALASGVLPPGYGQDPVASWSSVWKLDREHGTATLEQPPCPGTPQ